jgi:hypothetical protein
MNQSGVAGAAAAPDPDAVTHALHGVTASNSSVFEFV